MAEIRLTSWGWENISLLYRFGIHPRWLFGISSINRRISWDPYKVGPGSVISGVTNVTTYISRVFWPQANPCIRPFFWGYNSTLITGRGPPCLGLDMYRVLLDLQSPPVLRSHVFFWSISTDREDRCEWSSWGYVPCVCWKFLIDCCYCCWFRYDEICQGWQCVMYSSGTTNEGPDSLLVGKVALQFGILPSSPFVVLFLFMGEISYGNGTFSILFIVGDWAQSQPGPGWHFILIGDLSKYSQSKEELDMSGDGQTHGLGFDLCVRNIRKHVFSCTCCRPQWLFLQPLHWHLPRNSLSNPLFPWICFLKVPFIFHYAVDDEKRSLGEKIQF